MKSMKNLGFVLVAMLLVAGLAVLYAKTETIDLREPNRIAGSLRDLKEIDARWDVDVLRASLESDVQAVAPVSRREDAEKALTSLEKAAANTGSEALNTDLAELVREFRNKARLVDQFMSIHAQTKAALAGVRTHTKDLGNQAAQMKLQSARMDESIERLNVAAAIYFTLGQEDRYNAVYSALTDLDALANGFPQVLRERATLATDAGRALLDRKAEQMRLVGEIGRSTSGPRIEHMTQQFSQELETVTHDKEVYRVYLITYAAVLLVVVAWMGVKVRAANRRLEQRVRERTHELSSALAQLKESEAQLIQSEKLSSLGRMVAGVAHEINTPLAYVRNSLRAVGERLPQFDKMINATEGLVKALQAGSNADPQALTQQFATVTQLVTQFRSGNVVGELTGLVNDGVHGTSQVSEIVANLKDFSRLDRGNMTKFDLREGLNSTLEMAKHELGTAKVEKVFAEVPPVLCSPSKINQVFLNLITNAAQALKRDGGKIVIRTRKQPNGVAVDVEDNGSGIPPDVLPKIFDPFFTTKDVGRGTGLGLSISYKIVKQHGGRIEVDSTPEKGSRFTVFLPFEPPAGAGSTA